MHRKSSDYKAEETNVQRNEDAVAHHSRIAAMHSNSLSSAQTDAQIKYSNLSGGHMYTVGYQPDSEAKSDNTKPSSSMDTYDDHSNSNYDANSDDQDDDDEEEDDDDDSENDPFRQAPLYVYNFSHANDTTNTTGSNSSTTSNSYKSSSIDSSANSTRLDEDQHNQQSSLLLQQPPKTSGSGTTIGLHSAFQPYKKQPDPFISAPFDLTPSHHHHHHHGSQNAPLLPPPPQPEQHQQQQRKVSASSTSNSVTPTNNLTSNKKSSTTAVDSVDVSNGSKKKSSVNNESNNAVAENEDDEVVEVIRNTKLIKSLETPVSNKKKAAHLNNPFVAAPFTAKKTSTSKLAQFGVPSSSSSNSIFNTPSTSSATHSFVRVQPTHAVAEQSSGHMQHQQPLEQNLMLAYDHNERSTVVQQQQQQQQHHRVSQSQSLNEIQATLGSNSANSVSFLQHQGTVDVVDTTQNQQRSDFMNARQQKPVVPVKPTALSGSSKTLQSVQQQHQQQQHSDHHSKNANCGGISNMSFDDY
jgi:hypothetical protein